MQLIWQNLGGLAKDQITLNNVRIFLLAVMGTYIEPGLNREEQNLSKLDNDFGLFNDFGDLFLEPAEIPKIQRLYQPLYTIRMQHEAKQLVLKKRERSLTKEFEFTPNVSSNSREMAQRFRDKLQQEMQGRLNSLDFLRQPAKDPKFAEVASLLIQKDELKECTFKPQINQFKSPKSKKSPILTQKSPPRPASAVKFRSKDVMPRSGNKFNDLYALSKILQKKGYKTTEEYEFERNRAHLTFKPTINTRSAAKPSDRRSPVIDDSAPAAVRGLEKSVERIRKGRERLEQLKYFQETGRLHH